MSKERWHFLASFIACCCHVTWKCCMWFPGRLFKGCWLSWVCPSCPCPLLFFMLPGISNDGWWSRGYFGPRGDLEKGTMWYGQEPLSWSGAANLWNTFPWERHISYSSFCLCELLLSAQSRPILSYLNNSWHSYNKAFMSSKVWSVLLPNSIFLTTV